VAIADFGLVRAVDQPRITQSGWLAGTPSYMSPEQARGEPVDVRSDLFSLGSVLYAACTGKAPFEADTAMATMKRICDEPAADLRLARPDVPEGLADIIARLHAKDPADRFQSASEVADSLRQDLTQPGAWTIALSRKRRIRAVAIGAGLLLAISVIGLTEATGLTQMMPQVLRIFTPDGTLIVEVNDPNVKVVLDSNGKEIVVEGIGMHKVRVRPGEWKVSASRDGKPVPVSQEILNITRGDTQVVRISREAPAPASAAAAADAKAAADVERVSGVLAGNPNDLPARMERAQRFMALKRMDEALADLSKIIELVPEDPNWAGAYVVRAEIKRGRGDWQDAIADYQTWSKLRPKEAFGDGRVATLLLFAPPQHRDADQARQLLEKILKIHPGDHGYTTSLGIAYLRLDRLPEALTTLEKATTLRPGPNSFDQFALALAHHRLGDTAKAQASYDKAVKMYPASGQGTTFHATFALAVLRAEAEQVFAGDKKNP
jgi:tetratricopeptide (TPR) repeat protein